MNRYKAVRIEFHRGYPFALSRLLPSVQVKNKVYIDGDLDEEWCYEYTTQRSEAKQSKWLKGRLAERTVIFEVSVSFGFRPCIVDYVQHGKACQKWLESRRNFHVSLRKAM